MSSRTIYKVLKRHCLNILKCNILNREQIVIGIVFTTTSLKDALFRQSLSPGVYAVSKRDFRISDTSRGNAVFDFMNTDGKLELSVVCHPILKQDGSDNVEEPCRVLFGLTINDDPTRGLNGCLTLFCYSWCFNIN